MIILLTVFAIILALVVYYHVTIISALQEKHETERQQAIISYEALLLQIADHTAAFRQKEKEHLAALDKKYYDDYVDLARAVHDKLKKQEEQDKGDRELAEALKKASLYYVETEGH